MVLAPEPAAAHDLLTAAKALRPVVTAAADEIEEGRRLPLHIVQAMKEAGVFRMTMPREWGGPEADPLLQIEVVEELSAQNGSVGWCAMIGSDGGYFSGMLEQGEARAMYEDLDAVTGGAARPNGRAVAVEGGYRVSGRWPFGSGCQHSTWMASGCFIYDGDVPRQGANGQPVFLSAMVPGNECEIIDTWRTTGLRGSGSHDYAVHDVFVPEARTFSFLTSRPRRPEPLYQFPMMFLCNQPAVPLGIARAALDEVLSIATKKVNFGGNSMRDDVLTQAAIGREDARIGAARSLVLTTVGDLWRTLCNGKPVSIEQRARFRSAIVFAHEECVAAVDHLYTVCGSGALYSGSVLDRCLRDIHTLNQHVIASPGVYANAGRMLLGFDAPSFY